jgi:hypothetical protein
VPQDLQNFASSSLIVAQEANTVGIASVTLFALCSLLYHGAVGGSERSATGINQREASSRSISSRYPLLVVSSC